MNTKQGSAVIIGLFIILLSILLIADGNIVLGIIIIDVVCMFLLNVYFEIGERRRQKGKDGE